MLASGIPLSRARGAPKSLFVKTRSIFAAVVLSSAACQAEDKSTLSLTIENDSFFGTDRYYTQGTRLQYMHKPNSVPTFVGNVLTNFANLGMSVERTRIGFAVGQEFYTPSKIRSTVANPADRPYAGWIHGSVILRRVGTFDPIPGLAVQDEFELDLGVVGPHSFSEDTQKWWHNLWGYTQPRGWDTQLKTEPVFQMYFNRAFRIGYETENFWGVEMIPHGKLALGTVYVYAESGVTMRAGYNLPRDFTRSPMESYSTHPSDHEPNWSAYVFTGMDGRAVAHNMFLDGSNWRSSQSIDKNNFVADFRAGGAIRYKGVEFVASAVHRTREFKGQIAGENFLSITTQWHF
jgi:lipid A 3-O-deacylase